MTSPSPVEAIFVAALDQPAGLSREVYLAEACRGDDDLRRRVERLLDAHPQVGGFLEKPAAEGTGAYVSAEPAAGVPGERIGPYKLLQKLGEGGMGAVWMAEQEQPVRRRVALKVIKAGMDSAQVVARFEAERQALALMDHPNIAKVLDAGTTESGRPYVVMELVKGIPITRFCDQEHLTPKERLGLFIPVCQAVQHAHQKGIIHRDLKPSNVLIALYDGRPVPKVIDFGVAKATGTKLTERTLFTEVGNIVGTLEYMAPEQAELNNLDIDTRADIYALGVLLYELLTGSPPFTRKQLRSAAFTEMLRMIREVEPPKPSTRLSGSDELPSIAANRKLEPAKLARLVRGDLDWIVMEALEKDRARRYETANGLALDVQRYLADEPVEACPPSAAYRLRKFVRKHRPALATVVVCAALLLAGTAVSTWQALRATRAERLARDRLAEVQAANVQTEHALKESEQAREQAESVSQFLIAVFDKPNPFRAERPLTVVELLGQAEKSLHSNTNLSPATRATLLAAIGETYESLGLYQDEVRAFEAVCTLRRNHLGSDHSDTLKSMHRLAGAYRLAGRFADALPLHEETLRRRQVTLGPDYPSTLDSMTELARSYRDVGRLPEALQLFEEALRLCRATLGPNHRATLLSMNALATAYQDVGRFTDGLRLFEEALRVRRATLGPDNPNTLWTMHDLAGTYWAVGRLADALDLYEKTLRLRQARLGPDHSNTADTMVQFGHFHLQQRRYAEAEPLLRQGLAIYETKLPGTWRVANAQSLLGAALAGQQNYAEAGPLLLEGYQGLKARAQSIRAPERPRLLTQALERLVQLYEATGKPDEAAKWRTELEAVKK